MKFVKAALVTCVQVLRKYTWLHSTSMSGVPNIYTLTDGNELRKHENIYWNSSVIHTPYECVQWLCPTVGGNIHI